MSEDTNEETQTPDETGEESTSENQGGEETAGENQTKVFQTLRAQKEHFREKSQKLQDELGKVQEKLKSFSEKSSQDNSDDFWKKKTDFLLTNQVKGYDKEDIERLEIIVKGSNKTFTEAESDVLFKSYIENKQIKGRAEEATPAPSAPEPIKVGGKPWQDIVSDPKLSRDDKNASYTEMWKGLRAKRKGGTGL